MRHQTASVRTSATWSAQAAILTARMTIAARRLWWYVRRLDLPFSRSVHSSQRTGKERADGAHYVFIPSVSPKAVIGATS